MSQKPVDIPQDVLAAAKKAAYLTEETGDGAAAITSLIGVDIIARAIMAERERCAKIAERMLKFEIASRPHPRPGEP